MDDCRHRRGCHELAARGRQVDAIGQADPDPLPGIVDDVPCERTVGGEHPAPVHQLHIGQFVGQAVVEGVDQRDVRFERAVETVGPDRCESHRQATRAPLAPARRMRSRISVSHAGSTSAEPGATATPARSM